MISSPRIREFLRLQRLAMALAGLSFGLILTIIENWLSSQGLVPLPWVIAIAVISGGMSIILLLRKRIGIEVAIRSPLIIRTLAEAQQYARRGAIAFVPLYRPNRDTAAAKLSVAEWDRAVEALDFDRLQLEESNFYPTIKALTSHASKLEHCWLLATEGKEDMRGSLPYAPVLAAYLREHKGLRCKFHFGAAYTIPLHDDALVISKTYDHVQRIFEQAIRLKIAPQELVADITSGIRSMTLGMVLACLNGDQDVEFVGTRYDDQGWPVGDIFPIIYSFEPTLHEKE